MKQDSKLLEQLSRNLGVSRATISKTIRHCSGVDSATRLRILKASAAIPELQSDGQYDIYCVLPDTPSFFWKEMRRGIADGIAHLGTPLSVKCNVYSRLRDEDTVLYYLAEAEQMQAPVLVLAVSVTDAVRAALARMNDGIRRCVLFLSEFGDVTNSFYIGADAYSDGAAMGQRFASAFAAQTPLYLLSIRDNVNVEQRILGFTAALGDAAAPIPLTLDAEHITNPKTLPSHLAALLSDAARETEPACLYVPFSAAGLGLAVEKAGLGGRLSCFCHDPAPDSSFHPFAVCTQDVYAQGRRAIRAAEDYMHCRMFPEEKYLCVPSKFNFTKGNLT